MVKEQVPTKDMNRRVDDTRGCVAKGEDEDLYPRKYPLKLARIVLDMQEEMTYYQELNDSWAYLNSELGALLNSSPKLSISPLSKHALMRGFQAYPWTCSPGSHCRVREKIDAITCTISQPTPVLVLHLGITKKWRNEILFTPDALPLPISSAR